MKMLLWLKIRLRRWWKWDRYTDRLRAVMRLANREGMNLHASTITAEHFLAAIVHEGSGVGMTLLRSSGVIESDVKHPYDAPTPISAESFPPERKLPLDQSLHHLVKVAIEEAVGLHDDYVGTEHMVLALVDCAGGPLQAPMAQAGLTSADVRVNLSMLRLWNAGDEAQAGQKWKQAVACYRRAIALKPAERALSNNLAWILATCPDEAIRSGQEALHLMKFLDSDSAGAPGWMLGTLAAAYAAAGNFDRANTWGIRAMQLAEGADKGRWVSWISGFAEGRPIRVG
jgi:hypothetical protein